MIIYVHNIYLIFLKDEGKNVCFTMAIQIRTYQNTLTLSI